NNISQQCMGRLRQDPKYVEMSNHLWNKRRLIKKAANDCQ
ncbi:2611_t:CDS:1, partial [Gigaspora rosea]